MSYDDSIMDFNAEAANGIVMEGYLYKRASNAFKTWSRCGHWPPERFLSLYVCSATSYFSPKQLFLVGFFTFSF
jgi:hypothetical protein